MGTGTLSGRRILLVEDHAGTASALTWLLRRQGYDLDEARTHAAAVDHIAATADHAPYDLLVCDIGLPDGSGCDLMAALRGRGAPTRGIVMSGFTDEATIQSARAAGFSRFLQKPVRFDELLTAIDQVLGSAPVVPTLAAQPV